MQQLPISQRPSASRHEASASGDVVLRFGRFCVLPRARRLLVDAQPVEIGSRAFDLMMVLIGAAGALVTKNELLSRVWSDTVVAEDNLKVQMSALRKVLNEDRDVIKTVHGRGYVFTGAVTATSVEKEATASPDTRSTLPLLGPGLGPDRSPRRTVVVIDDDPDVRAALQGLLRSAGLDVASFAAVQEFLDSPHPELPACLVLDVKLPGRSGLDFQEELVKANLRLPIIFISGCADVPMSVRAMKGGAIEFLTKPFCDRDLLDAIALAISPDRARRNHERAVVDPVQLVRRADVSPAQFDSRR